MPTYCYTCEHCGAGIEHEAALGRAPRFVRCACGQAAKRDIRSEQLRPPENRVDRWRGHVSRAMGVNPKQADLFRKQLAPHGIKVDNTGAIVCESPGAQKHAMKVLGYTYL